MTARWPRLMKQTSAAEYCDMTVPAFEREVLAGRLPVARLVGGKDHWDRTALDKAIDAIMGSTEVPAYRQKLKDRLNAEAA